MCIRDKGKRVGGDGAAVDVPTAPIIWGMPGTDGQHTFFQWLHQSAQGAPVDFIASLQGHPDSPCLLYTSRCV